MAIFGELNELPFPEVLSMLGRRSGQLHVQHTDHYTLHLDSDYLIALYRNHQLIHDPHQVRDIILRLTRATQGHFEFHRSSPNALVGAYRFPITRLLLGASVIIDEITHYRDRLPTPDTRFVLHHPGSNELNDELNAFLDRAERHLLLGASANDLARLMGENVEYLQLVLYKLRTSHIITPQRVANPGPSTPASATPTGLIARLLGALKHRRKAQA